MNISAQYVLTKKREKEKAGGFQAVEVQDNFVYEGEIVRLPDAPAYIGDRALAVGDVVLFHKYSPDTVEIELEGIKHKFVKHCDLLAVL